MDKIQRIAPLVGRLLLTLIFLLSGLNKIGNWDQTAAYMASKGCPSCLSSWSGRSSSNSSEASLSFWG